MNSKYKKILSYMSVFILHTTYSTVEWSGSSCPDVTDEDIIINGDCQLEGETNIMALTTNITISVVDEDTDITPLIASPSSDPTVLYLTVNEPYTITIIIKKHLKFKGCACFKDKPLSIIIQGTGSVRWLLEEDGKVSFTANSNSGGTELWLYSNTNSTPHSSFIIHDKGQVHFGKRSKWGYMLDYCLDSTGQTTIENRDNTFITFKDKSSFILEAY